MLSKKMEKALNDQLNAEMFSSYLYLSMAVYFDDKNLEGFAHWMKIQAQEELMHSMKFFNFIQSRGAQVVLGDIKAPEKEWKSPLAAFEAALEHECYISKRINDLANLATEERDNATNQFLQWFIAEQVEEEESARRVIDNLKLAGDAPGTFFILDREMATRTAAPAAGEA